LVPAYLGTGQVSREAALDVLSLTGHESLWRAGSDHELRMNHAPEMSQPHYVTSCRWRRALPQPVAFRLLGVHPGPEIPV